jgi:branched-chain amino acid aminotransferase
MKYLYTDGRFLSIAKNNVSTMVQAFNYGTAAFEGMKAFYSRERSKWFLFRPEEHYRRLKQSTSMLDIDFEMSLDEFVNIIATLIRKNNDRSDVYIRPIVFRSQKGVGLFKPSGYAVSIFTQPVPHSSANEYRCCFVSQRRPVDGTYSVKITGNYVLSFFSQREATNKGYDVGILLSTNGYVSEASVMNLFFVDDGKLFTPSLACGPLGGITRKSVMQLANAELGIKVIEGKYRPARLLEADEVFFCGTGSGINYARQIEKRKFNLTNVNSIAKQITELLAAVTQGKVSRYSDWLRPL